MVTFKLKQQINSSQLSTSEGVVEVVDGQFIEISNELAEVFVANNLGTIENVSGEEIVASVVQLPGVDFSDGEQEEFEEEEDGEEDESEEEDGESKEEAAQSEMTDNEEEAMLKGLLHQSMEELLIIAKEYKIPSSEYKGLRKMDLAKLLVKRSKD